MKSLGQDAAILPIDIAEDGTVRVEDEPIGRVEGLRFHVDPAAGHADRKMLLAAAERALPQHLAARANALVAADLPGVELRGGAIRWDKQVLAELVHKPGTEKPELKPSRDVAGLPAPSRDGLLAALDTWLEKQIEPLAPLEALHEAARNPEAGSQARALCLTLIDGKGYVARDKAGIEHLPKELRPFLRKLGVTFGALDIFSPALLKPAPRRALHALRRDTRPLEEAMRSVLPAAKSIPTGYRRAGEQFIRIDMAERIVKAAHDARAKAQSTDRRAPFRLDLALPVSIGLTEDSAIRLLGQAGFRFTRARTLTEGTFGPPAPGSWNWRPSGNRPPRGDRQNNPHKGQGKGKRLPPKRSEPPANGAFADLAKLLS